MTRCEKANNPKATPIKNEVAFLVFLYPTIPRMKITDVKIKFHKVTGFISRIIELISVREYSTGTRNVLCNLINVIDNHNEDRSAPPVDGLY